ncbi:ribosomal protein S5 domain 2-type protein [Pterulicium gracile]|uniref:Ribosomal protein S5 domain 2-type protein n=1 Tax=Pterulicium gracile TaxID=1884261 RepID=A0A5C3Q810_9AGAR|nr:ribosomal protein S5 domain 2-type protein [Pterula gracilis]
MRPPSPSIPEREFLLESLSQSLRIDGRLPLELRTPVIQFGPELGWVQCSYGKTHAIAYVDAKIVKPEAARPFEGLISINSEISPMASTEYETGRTSDEEVTVTRMLDKILRRSDAIDKESLCILAGKRVWHLRLTVQFLADSGNMLDCGCLAGIIAFKHFRRPDVEVIGDEVIVHSPSERAPIPLSLHHTPLCFTFAFYRPPTATTTSSSSSEPILIIDPSQLEQRLAAGLVSIALNAQKEICVLNKLGGVPLGPEDLLRVIEVAVEKAREVDKLVEKALADDWEERKATVELR